MRKAFLILIFCVFTVNLFADYGAYVRNGVSEYKSGNYTEAARWFKRAYKLKPNAKLKKYYLAAVKKGYRGNITQGNTAYRSGDINSALAFYEKAYSVYPNKKLKSMIDKLSMRAGAAPGIEINGRETAGGGNPLKWVLIGGDVALAGLTTWLFIDQKDAADAYNELHSLIDKTTTENYELLKTERDKAAGKQTLFGLSMGVTTAAIAYTLVDLFALHIVFPKQVKTGYNPESNRYELALSVEF